MVAMPDSSSWAGITIRNFELGSVGAERARGRREIAASEVASREEEVGQDRQVRRRPGRMPVDQPRSMRVHRAQDDPRGDLGERGHECGDVVASRERAGAQAQRAVGEGPEGAVDIGSTVQAGPDGDVEARVEDRAEVLRRERLRGR